jgi:hypothetical protein
MEPWKNLTVVKCRLKRPSSSRSGGFLETKGLIKTDIRWKLNAYQWAVLRYSRLLVINNKTGISV